MNSAVVKIAAILPVFNRVDETLKCLSRLLSLQTEKIDIKVVLVDDGSTDGTNIKVSEQFPSVIVLKGNGNLWWAGGVNEGLRYIGNNVGCDYILILNNDTLFLKNPLEKLIEVIRRDVKIVCCPVVIDEESGRIYAAGQKIKGLFQELKPLYKGEDMSKHYNEIIECDSVGSRFVLMPKRIVGDIGFFDQSRFPHSYSDFEYFLRAKKVGYKILVITNSRVSTKQNKNYMNYRLIECSTFEYLKSFFDIRYGNNLKLLFYQSLVYKNFFFGLLLFSKKILSHSRWITYKIILPRAILERIIKKKWII